MNGRERIKAALAFQPTDKVGLQYYYTPVGYYEHGEKLNDLYASLPGDFEPFARRPIPTLSPAVLDAEGKYHEFRKDEWGTVWEYRIYGIAGIPHERPLADLSKLKDYRAPAVPIPAGPAFEAERERVRAHQKEHFYQLSAGSLFERMLELRGDADVYCDLADDTPEINEIADLIAQYARRRVEYGVALGVDGIGFGDDYGTERSLIISPALWRSFFKPRLKWIFEPAVRAGIPVLFHSCGRVGEILEDLREVGAASIWPQLPAYDRKELAAVCRSLGLAVAVHTDRANTMTFGTPEQVRELVKREYETFRMGDGGAWFYVESDNGFPFENLQALVGQIAEWR